MLLKVFRAIKLNHIKRELNKSRVREEQNSDQIFAHFNTQKWFH